MIFCPKCGGVMEEKLIPWCGFVANVHVCQMCGYYGETYNTNTTEVEP